MHFLFAVMIPPSAARDFRRHLPAMSIKTTLHATAPLLYPCWRYPKCPLGLYASPLLVAMAVVGWFLCFPAFFGKNGFFFPIRDLRQKKIYATYTKKKKHFRQKKTRLTPKRKSYATYAKKKATYASFHNRVTLSSVFPCCRPCYMCPYFVCYAVKVIIERFKLHDVVEQRKYEYIIKALSPLFQADPIPHPPLQYTQGILCLVYPRTKLF